MALTNVSPVGPRERLDLARIRQRSGVTLNQIVESTKISKRFLVAIEEEEFEKLPGGIFNTSYLRQYAREIDLDEEELLAYYNSKICLTPASEENASLPKKKPASKGFRLPLSLVRH